ncbi:conserved hypothetical protein [Beggiatoa sp. PS]|nr:conserved hypothetical protein [Beggiatoa sp. PS]
MGNLKLLKILDLSKNQFSGTIPNSIGNLRQLERLYLNNNQLSSFIPESIGNLGQLRHLRLHENALCGNVPLSFMNFHALGRNELSLKGNHLTASNQSLINWLNRFDNGWETSQTICPQKVLLMTLVILLLLGIGIGTVIAIRKTSMTPKQLFIVFFQKTFGILGVSVWKLFGIYMILLGILSIITPIVSLIKYPPLIMHQHSIITFLIGSVGIILFYAAFVFVGYHLIRYGYRFIRGLENHSIKAHWKGDARLVSAFWGFGIIGTPILSILIPLSFGLFINSLLDLFGINVSASFALPEVGLVFLILGIYSVFVVVSIWRCAWNTNNKMWGYLARFFVIIKVILLSWIILGGAFIPLIINIL